jgi:hypothetical protein
MHLFRGDDRGVERVLKAKLARKLIHSDDGISPTMPMLGDISKNRAPLNLIPLREEADHIWLTSLRRGSTGSISED